MNSKKSRELILSRIRRSMKEGREFSIPPHDQVTPVFPTPSNLLQTFEKELKAIGGQVIICNNLTEIKNKLAHICKQKNIPSVYCIDPIIQNILAQTHLNIDSTPDAFNDMQIGITQCERLVSRTGTVVISSNHASGRRLNVFPPIHIVIAKASQLVPFPDDALEWLGNRYGNNFPSLISFITGASRTADIEKTLVMGAHGPKEIFVFIDKNA